jgi:hypothetical protein
MSKVFRSLDPLVPALYGSVIPVFVEVTVAVIFIAVCYGWLAVVQLALFVGYTGLS